jgi:WD40 repeat protein
MAELTPEEKEAAAAMYNHLVTPSGTKIAHGVGDLAGYASVPPVEAGRVLDKLVRERIVRASSDDGAAATRYEIFHDVLADAVLAWRSRHEEQRALRREQEGRRRARIVASLALAGLVVVGAIAVFALVERGNAPAATGAQIAIMIGHTGPLTSVAFNPSGTALVSTSTDGTARVWGATAADGGRMTSVLAGHRAPVVSATFSSDGRTVLTAGEDGTARLWDPGSEPELTLRFRDRSAISGLAVSPDGGRLLVGDAGGTARVLSTDGRRVLRTPRADGDITDVAFGPRGPVLAVAPEQAVALSADGKLEAVAVGRTVRLGAPGAAHLRVLRPRGGVVRDLAFSPDDRLLGMAMDDRVARLWDVGEGQEVHVLRGHRGPVNSIAFSPDGELVVTGSNDHDARLWDPETGRSIRRLHRHFGPVLDARFSPDGRWVVTGGPITAGLWDMAHESVPGFLRAPVAKPLSQSAFGGPDGRLVVAASRDGSLRAYYCDICGDVRELLALAKRRLGD